jgi:hypothetical protein
MAALLQLVDQAVEVALAAEPLTVALVLLEQLPA